MSTPVIDSQALTAERKKSNLAFTFMSLKPERREAMAVFYDFCRVVDDIADDANESDTNKSVQLEAWRAAILACYQGAPVPTFARPLQKIIQQFQINQQPLIDIIDGVSMDIGGAYYETFYDLQKYCYGVASAVGLVCIQIFGCKHPQSSAYAETLGYALQFTNILRDVVEDYHDMGRIYLPREELRALGIKDEDLGNPENNENCKTLFRLCYFRCKHFFNKARRLLPPSERQNLKAALIMSAFYEEILEKIKANDFNLTQQRVRISKSRKLQLLWQTLRSLKKPMEPVAAPGSVAILGGGVSGISSAISMGLEGFTPHIYEAKTFLGGRAHSLTDATTGLTLDNGQHIVMGCYEHFLRMVDVLGVHHKLDKQARMTVPYVSPGERWSKLKAQKLPAPFHLLMGLFNFNELNTNDRLSIMRMGTVIRLQASPHSEDTVAQWLKRNKQTQGAIRALWEPFCIAALNEPINTASATLLYTTLRQSLFGKADDATIFLSKVGLSDLFNPEIELFLKSIGGSLQPQHQIKTIHFEENTVKAITTSKGKTITADVYLSALNWNALAQLLPDAHPLRAQISQIPSSAILSIHLLCDKELFESEATFVGLLDSPIHWVFDRSATLPNKYKDKSLYAVIISAANDWIDLKSEALVAQLKEELARFFPAAQAFTIDHHLVYKSKDATFAARPSTEPLRPHADTPWANLFLAGDWVKTGIPATLEGAAQSGFNVIKSIDKIQAHATS